MFDFACFAPIVHSVGVGMRTVADWLSQSECRID